MAVVLKIVLFTLLGIAGLFLAYILLIIISSQCVNMKKEYERESKYFRWLLNSSTYLMTKISRIHIHTTGVEKIPAGRFLAVCNHRSKFDPILSWLVFYDRQIAFISKPENFKVPFYGKMIHRLCFMPIDRENPRNAVKTINRAADLMVRDIASVAVYPEGTRNTEPGLLPFHNAVFKAAKKAGVPVVVMTAKNTELIQKNFPLHRSDVYFDIIKIFSADEVKVMKTSELGEKSAELMLKNLEG